MSGLDNVSLDVAVIPSMTCFINLPLSLHLQEPPLTFAIKQHDGKVSHVGWGGGASQDKSIEVPAALAEALGLRTGQAIRMSAVDLPKAHSLWVCPESAADWEAANRDAETLKDQVLMQILAAQVGQRLPLWVRGTECIWVQVDRAEPAAPAVRLAAGTDLIVAPPPSVQGENGAAAASNRAARWHNLRVGASEQLASDLVAQGGELAIGLDDSTMRLLGVTEGDLLWLKAAGSRPNGPGGIQDRRRAAPPACAFGHVVRLPGAASPYEHAMLSPTLRRALGKELGTHIRVRWLPLSSASAPAATPTSSAAPLPRKPTSVTISFLDGGEASSMTEAPKEEAAKEALDQWLSANATGHERIHLAQGAVLNFPHFGLVQLTFDSNLGGAPSSVSPAVTIGPPALQTPPMFLLSMGWANSPGHSTSLGPRKAWLGAAVGGGGGGGLATELRLLSPDWKETGDTALGNHPNDLGGRVDDLDAVVKFCRGALQSQADGQADGALLGLLLTGPRGVGKTAIAEAVSARLSRQTHAQGCSCAEEATTPAIGEGALETGAPAWAMSVPAEALLTAQQPAVLLSKLHGIITRARKAAPAIVILDDLHKVLPTMPPAPELATVPLQEAVAELFAAFAHEPRRPPIVFIAISPSSDRLHPSLRTAGLFDTEHRLGTPDRRSREQALAALASHQRIECQSDAATWAAKATEGFVAAELRQLLDGARLSAAARQLLPPAAQRGHSEGEALYITCDDFQAALPHVTCQLRSGGDKRKSPEDLGGASWADVGGLEQVKRVLIESVILPRDHPELFAGAPIRLTSGALLYGHSGCGKTLLARALAAEAGLPFLTIKGPELLNKYIGASEAAVRDLFERAASCRPCILFFDEFEAIAPRRGQDATGVTDRVVNQLLCELDGVEALEGVFVLAASNRPELIDPALLRPGRLDRKLLCPMPSLEDRFEILSAFMKRAPCAPELMSETATRLLAARCDGFSGADLQALLYNAQLNAIHTAIGPGLTLATGQDGGEEGRNSGKGPLNATQAARVRAAIDPESPWLHAPDEWASLVAPTTMNNSHESSVVTITQEHMDDALEVTHPSISPVQLQEREDAFRSFADGSLGKFAASGTGEQAEGQGGSRSVLRAALQRAVHA